MVQPSRWSSSWWLIIAFTIKYFNTSSINLMLDLMIEHQVLMIEFWVNGCTTNLILELSKFMLVVLSLMVVVSKLMLDFYVGGRPAWRKCPYYFVRLLVVTGHHKVNVKPWVNTVLSFIRYCYHRKRIVKYYCLLTEGDSLLCHTGSVWWGTSKHVG